MATESPDSATKTMLRNIPEKTGKSLDDWKGILNQANLTKHGEMLKLLKDDHDVSHGFANLIVHQFRESATGTKSNSTADLVSSQYQGPKVELLPIYEDIIKMATSFGNDVEVSPKKTYVSLRRTKQFALVQPSTRERVDVGINLKGTKPTERLEKSGSFNAMVSHRVRITTKKQVNAELKNWLRQAYDAA